MESPYNDGNIDDFDFFNLLRDMPDKLESPWVILLNNNYNGTFDKEELRLVQKFLFSIGYKWNDRTTDYHYGGTSQHPVMFASDIDDNSKYFYYVSNLDVSDGYNNRDLQTYIDGDYQKYDSKNIINSMPIEDEINESESDDYFWDYITDTNTTLQEPWVLKLNHNVTLTQLVQIQSILLKLGYHWVAGKDFKIENYEMFDIRTIYCHSKEEGLRVSDMEFYNWSGFEDYKVYTQNEFSKNLGMINESTDDWFFDAIKGDAETPSGYFGSKSIDDIKLICSFLKYVGYELNSNDFELLYNSPYKVVMFDYQNKGTIGKWIIDAYTDRDVSDVRDQLYLNFTNPNFREYSKKEISEVVNLMGIGKSGNEKIKGGKSSGKSMTDIAKHHNVKLSVLYKELKSGIKVEMEHTNDPDLAKEIAKDHLWEIPDYYTKLKKMESNG